MLSVAALTLAAATRPSLPQEVAPAAVIPQAVIPEPVAPAAVPQPVAPAAVPEPLAPAAVPQPVAPAAAAEPAAAPAQGVTDELRVNAAKYQAAAPAQPCDAAVLKQIKGTDDPRALAACLDAATTGVEAALVLNYATQIETAMRPGPRADANLRRRVLLNHAFFWKANHPPVGPAQEAAFDQAVGGLLVEMKTTFMAKHTGKEKLLFSHISKAGGTSFHDLAVTNHKIMPSDVDSDGGWMSGDGPMWCCDKPVELTCADRIAKMGNNELVFQERYIDANGGVGKPQLCEEIVYGVMFRKPIDRIMSHLNELSHYLHFEAADPENNMIGRLVDVIEAGCSDDEAPANALYADPAAAEWKKKATDPLFGRNICGVASNYMTRSMVGSAVFGEGSNVFTTHFNDTLAEDSLDDAIATVQSMSLVLLLEESAEDQSQLDYFKLTMGFDTANLASHHMRSTSPEDASTDEYHHGMLLMKEKLDVKEQAMLQAHNEADLRLYDVAKMVFAQDLFFHAYVAGKSVTVPRWKASAYAPPV